MLARSEQQDRSVEEAVSRFAGLWTVSIGRERRANHQDVAVLATELDEPDRLRRRDLFGGLIHEYEPA
jgi:hypothetical protein